MSPQEFLDKKVKESSYRIRYTIEYQNHDEIVIEQDDVIDLMKEYAELYAKRCLEIAAKKAVVKAYIRKDSKNSKYRLLLHNEQYDLLNTIQMYKVSKESITNIKLPEHI